MPDPQQLLAPDDDAPEPGMRPERARKLRPDPDPLAVADAADAQGDIPMRARSMLARRLHRYGAILDDPDSSAADVVAVGRALAALGGLSDGKPAQVFAPVLNLVLARRDDRGGPVLEMCRDTPSEISEKLPEKFSEK